MGAVKTVEASSFYKTGYGPIIRVELHQLYPTLSKNEKQVFSYYFQVSEDGTHMFRMTQDGVFRPFHNTEQAQEYSVLSFASVLFGYDRVLSATSIGAYQIMGFHHKRLGFKTPSDMFNAMETKEAQDMLFVKFIKSDPMLVDALAKKDWLTFARFYNGDTSRAAEYAEKIKRTYELLLRKEKK